MTKISVFTPTHNPKHLLDAYESLLGQTEEDWEWIVVLNGGGNIPVWDSRMKVYTSSEVDQGVGYWKKHAVSLCSSPLLLELDHDDMLSPTCLEEVINAFEENPDAGLVYSNTVQVGISGEPNLEVYDIRHGWNYRKVAGTDLFKPGHSNHGEVIYQETISLPATPHNISLIWYAPNHARAFSRKAYDEVGGYNPALKVCDDQDLMCKLYQYGEFVHIDRPLYLQRIHPGMTQRDQELNATIQTLTWDLYEAYLQPNLLAWTKRNNLFALDVGCGNTKTPGYVGVDAIKLADVDIIQKLPSMSKFETDSVGIIRVVDVLEHVKDSQKMMKEFNRVLAPGGMILSLTPSTDGRGAFQDPTHISFWNENSFWYYTGNMHEVSPQHNNDKPFQISRLRTYFPSNWHLENNIPYVQANLIKPDSKKRNGGLVQ